MGFIAERFTALQKRFPGTMNRAPLRDPYGVYGLHIARPDGRQYYFSAKSKTAGSIVSVHESLLEGAIMYGHQIVLAIGWDFYLFDPKEIRRLELYRNERNGATMVNFNMDIGRPLLASDGVKSGNTRQAPPAPTQPPDPPSTAMVASKNAVMTLFDAVEIPPTENYSS